MRIDEIIGGRIDCAILFLIKLGGSQARCLPNESLEKRRQATGKDSDRLIGDVISCKNLRENFSFNFSSIFWQNLSVKSFIDF